MVTTDGSGLRMASATRTGESTHNGRRRNLLHLLAVWDNPIFQRFFRSRLRIRKAVFWYLLTLIASTFVVTITYIGRTNAGVEPRDAAADLWLPILIIQGLILMMKGTGAVSAGLIQDKIDQTLDYQRLTPLSPLRNLIGYLFGLPVLEYVMFALTLPHLIFAIMVGQIPLVDVISVYLAFFTCVILYHVTGIAVGMVMSRWIWGYLLSIFMVLIVNVFLPLAVSQFGLKFLQYLSVWPVIGQKVLPIIVPAETIAMASRNPFFAMADAVPFYDWTLSPFVFTLLLQGVLIVTFTIMALRRWRSPTRHSLSKPYALAFLCAFVVLLIGNVWQAITGQRLPFPIFGETNIDELREPIAIGLPLVYCLVVWALCFVLFSIVIPSHHAYVRGIRRALKLERNAPAHWDDDSASLPFMSLFVAVALAGFWVLFGQIDASGFFDFLAGTGFSHWRLHVAFALVLVYTILLLQVVELRPSVLVILLVWILPVLVAIVFGAAVQYMGPPQVIVASISPLVLLVMAAFLPIEYLAPPGAETELDSLMVGVYSGLVFIVIQIVWLWRRWRTLRGGYDLWCRTKVAESANLALAQEID